MIVGYSNNIDLVKNGVMKFNKNYYRWLGI